MPDEWPFGNDVDHINYYVHEDFAEKFSHCSPIYDASDNLEQSQVTGIMQHAAELWNLSTQGTPLIYRGHSNHYNLAELCADSSVEKPAVLIDFRIGCRIEDEWLGEDCMDDCDNHGDANCHQNCHDNNACQNALATINEIDGCDDAMEVVFAGDQNLAHSCGMNSLRWQLDDVHEENDDTIGQRMRSLLITAVHELGHVLNLSHTSQAHSLMSFTYSDQWPRRHPSKWDKDCVLADDAKNYRSLWTHHQSLPVLASQWNDIEVHPFETTRGHAMDGAFWRGGKEVAYAILNSFHLGWAFIDYYVPPSPTTNLEFEEDGEDLFISEFIFNYHATPSFFSLGYDFNERISYHYHGDDPHNLNYPPKVKAVVSSDFFDTVSLDTFEICDNQTCTQMSPLQSSVPIAHTRDHHYDLDIVVTVTDTHQHLGGQINVHPGMEDGTTIRPGSTLTGQNTQIPSPQGYDHFEYRPLTDFKPAVACGRANLYDYNCLLAWAPRGALNGRVVYTYFRYDRDSDEIDWLGEAWGRSGTWTRGHVSAGWFEERFWLGWKGWTPNHSVKRTYSTEPGCYTCWSDAEGPEEPGPTEIVDPPTFYYPPYPMRVESGWSWTETNAPHRQRGGR